MHKNISYKLDSMMKSKIGIDFFIILFYFNVNSAFEFH